MTYRVLWAPEAEEKLEKILIRAPEFATVARQIDAHFDQGPEIFW